MNKSITLTVEGKDLYFLVTLDKYNKYINEMSMANKVAPAENFLMRCVEDESKEELKELLDVPGMPIHLASALIEEYSPDIKIVVGKPKPAPVASTKTA